MAEQTNIKITSDKLNKFNAGEKIQFTPYFIYDGIQQDVSSITMTIPRFPSQLKEKDLVAQSGTTQGIDSILDSTTVFKITSYKNLPAPNNIIQIYLEKEWYYPYYSDNKTKVVFDKTGVTDRSASSLLPGSLIQFTVANGNSASPLNGKILKLDRIVNSKQAVLNSPIPTTGSVMLQFNQNIAGIPKQDVLVSVNSNTASARDYARYEKYFNWTLSVKDINYLSTLNSNPYIKDVVIFSYSTDNGATKYLINQFKTENNSSRINVSTNSQLPSYSNISSLYIDDTKNSRLSIKTRIYDNILSSQTIHFFAKVIRFIDTTGNNNFSNASSITGHDWVPVTALMAAGV